MSSRTLFDPEEFGLSIGNVDDELLQELREQETDSIFDEEYTGRRVTWLGTEGRMVRLTWDEVHPVPGNIFDADKLVTYLEFMKESDSPVPAPAGWVGHAIDADDVAETQEAYARDELFDSHGMTRPFTTGDDDLDEYLRDRREMKWLLKKLSRGDEEYEDISAVIEEMEPLVEAAEERGDGDLGRVTVTLRDGNHRAYAAYLNGEPYVWVYITRGHEGERAGDLE